MLSDDKINRINELSKKKKGEGLTAEEESERKALHQEYLAGVRSSMKKHIEGIKVVDAEGNDLTPDKVKQIQKEQGLHQRDKE